jgi:GT2 family glycosyltransferase
MKILWVCLVCEQDIKWLPDYLTSIRRSTIVPTELLIIDSDSSEKVRTTIEQSGIEFIRYIPYTPSGRNRGFNPSFNLAVKIAIKEEYDWLASMSVRALPSRTWLEECLLSGNSSISAGMVTSLHLNNDNHKIIYNFGHFLGLSGAGLDFGRDVPVSLLETLTIDYKNPEGQVIWSPCSGGTLYRVKALKKATKLLTNNSCDLFHPKGFKSCNCFVLGFLIRAAGFHNICTPKAICFRDGKESTSRFPNSPGLLINQEINRIANIYSFWPDDLVHDSLELYFSEKRNTPLQMIDKRIIAVLAENLTRKWSRSNDIDTAFKVHLDNFLLIKAWMRNAK